jgi:hypothetical protein
MKSKRKQNHHGIAWGCALVFFGLAVAGHGGIISALTVGNGVPVLDEFGRPMQGSNEIEEAADRSRVELRTTTDAMVHPPLVTGAPHPFNPLLNPDSVGGIGMNASRANIGIFAMSLTNRPTEGTRLFARAFNAPTIEEASFYADSAMVTAPAGSVSSLPVRFGTAKPLDEGDDDEDGLNNSWEKAMGTDAPGGVSPDDWDGDGMLDLHEMLAGTGGTNANSLLSFRTIDPDEDPLSKGVGDYSKPVRVRWQSVPGKRYQLQFVPTLLGLQNFIPVPGVGDMDGVITAGTNEYEIDLLVDIPEGTTAGSFRVRLVHDGIEL